MDTKRNRNVLIYLVLQTFCIIGWYGMFVDTYPFPVFNPSLVQPLSLSLSLSVQLPPVIEVECDQVTHVRPRPRYCVDVKKLRLISSGLFSVMGAISDEKRFLRFL